MSDKDLHQETQQLDQNEYDDQKFEGNTIEIEQKNLSMNDHQNGQSQDLRIEDQISYELEEKLRVLQDFSANKDEEQIVNIKMHQLALCKILVFTHDKSHFLLVKAHTELGY